MKNRYYLIYGIVLLSAFSGCKNKPSGDSTSGDAHEKAPEKAEMRGEITITPMVVRQLYEDAILEMNEPGEYQQVSTGKTVFTYEATNFRLGTSDDQSHRGHLATYASGRHITLILNNEIHLASDQTSLIYTLKPGRYIALSFLTDPDYISLKSPEAYVIRQFTAGNVKQKEADLTGPNIFYHMPSGTLAGQDTRNVLLDFYLVNCTLSEKGLKVKVTIKDKTFMIHDWTPYVIHNLPVGENIITLELLDKNGKEVNSPYHSVTGKVVLYDREPV